MAVDVHGAASKIEESPISFRRNIYMILDAAHGNAKIAQPYQYKRKGKIRTKTGSIQQVVNTAARGFIVSKPILCLVILWVLRFMGDGD